MPFINGKNRDLIHKHGPVACQDVGDICFVFYDQMVKVWKREPRWRTADRIYNDFFDDDFMNYVCDQLYGKFSRPRIVNACDLAWQVFFLKYVMPYEDLKEFENGTI